jgi:CelD/BcsL family acetyltransferase involved in cellulose biosynthesis
MSLAETAPALAGTASGYRARVVAYQPDDWLPRAGDATLFQRRDWLTPFYQAVATHHADAAPLVAEVTDHDGTLVYRLPLLFHVGGIRRIEFADLGMTDFNAPLLGPAAPVSVPQARRALRALRKALPPHDLLHLAKMPGGTGGRPNPLLLAVPGMACAANGNLLVTGDSWNDFHFGLERTFRKELERSWRVFSREPDTGFHIVTDGDEAIAVLEEMEAVQRARMAALGQPYTLEEPVTADFYRRLLQHGVASGFARLTLLKAGSEIVAALLGVRDAQTYVMIRLVHAGGAWAKVSPGRLLIHKTLEQLHGEGWRRFDFSVGNYAYKRRFGPTRTPLYDLGLAATPLGLPAALRIRAGALLRQYPQARESVRRLLGKPPTREEA